jgi:hypothetical protein
MAGLKLPTLHEATKWPISYLSFDPENPRFTPDMDIDAGAPTDIIRELNNHADLGELIQSIAASGYADIEPLVVVQEQGKKSLIVLEGNRRRAALKLLTNKKLADSIGIGLPEVAPGADKTFSEVLVYRVRSREEARDFIGFKHINGPHRWDSFAKAQFAANWFLRDRRSGTTLREIARRMGDRHQTIRRMVAGYLVLQQAIDKRLFDIADRYNTVGVFGFSHLYTALTRPGYRDFLGLSEDWADTDPSPNPIASNKLKNLKQLLLWLYGSKSDDVPPAIGAQNPDVKKLGEILLVPRARAVMMSKSDLLTAYAMVETPLDLFEKSLTDAHQSLESAQGKLEAFDGKDASLLEIASQIDEKADLVFSVMKRQAELAKKTR